MTAGKGTLWTAPVLLALLTLGPADPATEEQLWRHRTLGKALFENPATQQQAVEELKKALDLAPGSLRDRLNYGLALLRAGDPKSAIAELEKVQKQDPKLPHTWFNLGVAHKRLGQYDDAIRQFEGMARLVPEEPVTQYNLGLLYNLADRREEALKKFETAARLDENLVAPRFQIYNYYRLQGDKAKLEEALAAFQASKKAQESAGDSEDLEWCFYAELYDPIQALPSVGGAAATAELQFEDQKLAGSWDPKTAGLMAIDALGENAADLLIWSRDGVRLYRRGGRPVEPSGLESIRNVTAVAAGDFDNDGLTDLCIVTGEGPALYRNAKGRFEAVRATLPDGHYDAALWLDFDHDYDLDLVLLGAKSALVRNEGALQFRDYSAHFPFAAGHATGAVAFRLEPDTKGIDLAVAYADRGGVLYRDRLRGVFEAVPLPVVPAGARSLQAADIDNDGRPDLAFASSSGIALAMNRQGAFKATPVAGAAGFAVAFADLDNRGFADLVAGRSVFRNEGLARLRPAKTTLPSAVAWAEADFDGDGRADLAAVAADGSLHLLLNRTVTKNRWLSVTLDGIKNLKSAAGAEVEVKAGRHYQKRLYGGVPLLFGLGSATQADTVRITWPNGLIQNQTNEAVSRLAVYKEAPRMSGSCPMVFAWNGRRFDFIADVLGVAPLGASASDSGTFPVDNDEYLQIPPGALAERDGSYEIRIAEELHEVTYLDQARLIAVDHPASIEIVTNDKFKSPPFPEFRLFGVERRIFPIAARDSRGRDVRDALIGRDRVYAAGFDRDARGVAQLHALELEFPADAARDNRSVLILNGWIDWADGSTFLAASQGGGGLVLPYLQVRDAAGKWRTVIEDMGMPSGGPKTIAVDLTGKFLGPARAVRIVTSTCLYWDQIYLSERTAPPEARLTALDAAAADLRLRGFSRAILDPRREQPEYYDYASWSPTAMWDQVPGLYTRYGDVGGLLRAVDDQFVIMGSGDELRLSFNARALPPLPAGWTRDFLFHVDGWSKDADANTAFAHSVEPLPFHGMSGYPYPATERFPDDAAHRAWRASYNTRRETRLMPRLVARKRRYNPKID